MPVERGNSAKWLCQESTKLRHLRWVIYAEFLVD
jgi:hypothetical protein